MQLGLGGLSNINLAFDVIDNIKKKKYLKFILFTIIYGGNRLFPLQD